MGAMVCVAFVVLVAVINGSARNRVLNTLAGVDLNPGVLTIAMTANCGIRGTKDMSDAL